MSFVLDSSCLIYLGKLKVLDKLKHIEGNKYIPEEVYNEVIKNGYSRGEPEVKYIENLIKTNELTIKNPKERLENYGKLSLADVDVISLAKEIKAVAIIDDNEASLLAEFNEVDYHGSIYLLILLMNKKVISKHDALKYIDEMISLGFYLSIEVYKELREKLNNI